MSANHGNTWAAWTAVTIGTLAFVVGGIGLMVYSWPLFWVGIGMLPLAAVVGFVMGKMGYGATPTSH